MAVKKKPIKYGGGVDVQGIGNIDLSQLAADLAPLYAEYGQTNDSPGANIPQTLPGTDGNGPVYEDIETEVSRVDNGDGTFTVTYRGSTDPNAPTYTRIEGTATTTTDPGVVTYEGSGASRVKITTYKDGRVVREASPEGVDTVDTVDTDTTPKPDPYTEWAKQQAALNAKKTKDDARILLAKTLRDYNLDSLAPFVFELIAQDKLVDANQDMFIAMIKDRPEYQKRFSANAIRLKNKLTELSPGTYIGMENAFKDTLKANGLPDKFYDDPQEDFAKWIEGDVAPSEIQERIERGYNAVANADPEVTRQMESLYGVTKSDLAAYFLDPTRAKPIIESKQIIRQAQAANIAARAVEQGGVNLASDEARTLYEDLAKRGFTEGQIMSAFQDVGKLGELKTTLGGEAALSQQDIIEGAFGIDTGSTIELEKRRRRRVGEFAGGGSFARTQGETSGSVTTSVGKAQ